MDRQKRPYRDASKWQSRSGGSAGVGPRPDPPPHVVMAEQLAERIDALTNWVERLDRAVAELRRAHRPQGASEGGREGDDRGIG